MKTSLTYGFILALCGSLMSMGFYFTGFHDTAAKLEIAQNIGMVLGMAIAIACIVLGMREKRSLAKPDAAWGYGSALGTGIMVGLIGAVLTCIYTYCYFAFINPHMSDVIMQMQLDKMEAKGMSADQIERAEPFIRKWMNPVMMTVSSFVMFFITNVVIALIAAAFVKNRPQTTTPTAA